MTPIRTATTTEPRGAVTAPAGLDVDAAYQALAARDRRFDGRIWFGVTSTGVYCRPVCPAQTPKAANVRFFASPAAAVSSGFRACKRCRPDSAPGSRHWDHRGDLAARALRLIAEGAVDDGGVAGLARTLHVSERHVHRTLVAEVGAGPLQLATSRRAQTAKLLVEQTPLPLAEVAFAAGFSSVRQFNDVMRREFGVPPSQLRRSPESPVAAADPRLVLRLRLRPPYDAAAVGEFLAARAIEGLELHIPSMGAQRGVEAEASTPRRLVAGHGWTHRRVVPLGAKTAVVDALVVDDHVVVRADADVRGTALLVSRVRRWLDLDAEPAMVGAALADDPALAPLVAARPGLRVPTTVDPWETVVRAIVGQQVSVAGARTILGRIVAAYGAPAGDLVAFPTAAELAVADPGDVAALGMPGARARTVVGVAAAVADGSLDLLAGDPADIGAALEALPGVGPWTSAYVRLRALGDPDVLPVTDLGIRHGARAVGLPEAPRALDEHARAWSPWRSYAAQHLWTAATPSTPSTQETS